MRRNWTRRWFQLEGWELVYYERRGARERKGEVQLRQVRERLGRTRHTKDILRFWARGLGCQRGHLARHASCDPGGWFRIPSGNRGTERHNV